MKVNQILRWAWLLARAWWSYTTRKRCSVCHINKPLTDQDSFVKMFGYYIVVDCALLHIELIGQHFSILTSSLIHQLMPTFSRSVGTSSSLIRSTTDNIASRSPSDWSLAVGALNSRLRHLLNCSFVLQQNARVGDKFMNQIQPIAARVPYMTCPGNHETA